MSPRRVVITGTSVITSLGHDVAAVWTRICNGHSGISPVQRFDCNQLRVRFGGEIKDFDARSHMPLESKTVRRMDRFVQFAIVAADTAVTQSGIDFNSTDPHRCGVIIGSGLGGLEEIEDQHTQLFDRGPERVSAFMIPRLMANSASGNVSVHWGLKGPGMAIVSAGASATQSIGNACQLIRMGTVDVMIAGGSEAPITAMGLSGFARMNALSARNNDPERASRPFDRDCDGFVLSEGAGLLVLEELEFARKRGANILAEILGYGTAFDGTPLITPDGSRGGAARAMTAALRDAQLDANDIDYVNAHGTGTRLGDKAESMAIRTVFGSHADTVAVSSTKGQLGHLLGASGGVESVFCVLAISTGTAPPTTNLDNPGDGCDLDYVPHQARDMRITNVLKNSFGFDGHNACLVFGA